MVAVPTYFMLGQALWSSGTIAWLDAEKASENVYYPYTVFPTNPLVPCFVYDHEEGKVDIDPPTNEFYRTRFTAQGVSNAGSENAADRLLYGPDITLVRRLCRMHGITGDNLTGRIAMLKKVKASAIDDGASNRWIKGVVGEVWDDVVTAYTKDVDPDERGIKYYIEKTFGGTVDIGGFFLSFGYVEASVGGEAYNNFKTKYEQLIADLRLEYGTSSTPFVLDVPSVNASYDTTRLLGVREAIYEVANSDPNVRLISQDDLPMNAVSGSFVPSESSILEIGHRMGRQMELAQVGRETLKNRGLPVYVMLGQSQLAGQQNGASLGSEGVYGSPLEGVTIWNHRSNAWETLSGAAFSGNSNTHERAVGQINNFGPDLSFGLNMLRRRHPEGVAIYKLGINSSSLDPAATQSPGGSWSKTGGINATNYDAAVESFARALLVLSTQINESGENVGRVPDVRGLVWIQGEGDTESIPISSAYEVNLTNFIENVRKDFATRTDELLPVVISRLIRTSGVFDLQGIEIVRTAQEAVADADDRVLISDQDAVELSTDKVHHSVSGIIRHGENLANTMVEILERIDEALITA